MTIDKQLLLAYQRKLKYLTCDAKHANFISEKQGGIGVRSFTRTYIGALLRDMEVHISNDENTTTHALSTSISEATKLYNWKLNKDGKLPPASSAAARAANTNISGKRLYNIMKTANNLVELA
jgi:hypothetical protein